MGMSKIRLLLLFAIHISQTVKNTVRFGSPQGHDGCGAGV